MSRKPALLASVIALAVTSPAFAGSSAPAPNASAAASQAEGGGQTHGGAQAQGGVQAKSPAKPAPSKATPEQRAEAERLDPLGRAAFWAREVDVDPRDAEAHIKLAKALRALGRYDEAAANADQVLVMTPTNLEALLESARARVAANEGFYAIDDAERAEAIAPRDWRPLALLAVALEQSDRDSEALAAHQKALALAPDNPATLTNLGMYYAAHGDPARAEPLLRKAAAEPGAAAQERQNLALVLGLEGRFDEAEQLERHDLPPQAVENNLAYLRADAAPPHARTWDSLKTSP
jgi:Flp pilus assembly protein TadD